MFFVVENPVAKLRKLQSGLERYERRTVTYCSFGEPFRKPTDLWGGFPPSLALPPPCSPGGRTIEIDSFLWTLRPDGTPCHLAAPRGSRTGIQGDGVAASEDDFELQSPEAVAVAEPSSNMAASYERLDAGVVDARTAFDGQAWEHTPWLTEMAKRDARWHGTWEHPREDRGPRLTVNKAQVRKFKGGMIEDMARYASKSNARRDLAALRAKIPERLSLAVCLAAEADFEKGHIAYPPASLFEET